MTTAPPPPDGPDGAPEPGPDSDTAADSPAGPACSTDAPPQAPAPVDLSPAAPHRTRRQLLLIRVLIVVAALSFLVTGIGPNLGSSSYRDFGVTWDEHVQSTYGDLSLAYYESGGRDTSSLEFSNLAIYPPAWEMGANLLTRGLDPLAKFERRHLLNALTGLLGALALAFVGWRCGRPFAGIFGAVALLGMPRWFGHMFVNSKDIPFAVGFTIAMLAMVHAFDGRPFTWRRALAIGLAIGFALSMRIGGVLLFAFGLAGIGLLILQRLLLWRFPAPAATPSPGPTSNTDAPPPSGSTQEQLSPSLGESPAATAPAAPADPTVSTFPTFAALRQLAIRLHVGDYLRFGGLVLLAVTVAWTLMVAGWPWLHYSPLWGPIDAFQTASSFPFKGESLFGGEYLHSWELPRTYLPVYLGITVPLVTLALAALGYAVSLWDALRRWREPRSIGLALLGLWLLFPVAYAMATRPNLYDGMRHFLFVLPALAWFAGQGVATLLPMIADRLPDGKPGGWLAAFVGFGYLVVLVNSTSIYGTWHTNVWWQVPALLALGYLVRSLCLPASSFLRAQVAIGLGAALLTAVPDMARLHPYQYTWFNRAAGYLAEAQFKYETDYWAASYREALYRINEYAKSNATKEHPIVVLVAGNNELMKTARLYASPQVELHRVWNSDDRPPADFHFFLAFTRNRMAMLYPDRPIVSRIQREGAIFTVIRAGTLATDAGFWRESPAWTEFPTADEFAQSQVPLSQAALHRNAQLTGQLDRADALAPQEPPASPAAEVPAGTTDAPPPAAD